MSEQKPTWFDLIPTWLRVWIFAVTGLLLGYVLFQTWEAVYGVALAVLGLFQSNQSSPRKKEREQRKAYVKLVDKVESVQLRSAKVAKEAQAKNEAAAKKEKKEIIAENITIASDVAQKSTEHIRREHMARVRRVLDQPWDDNGGS